MYVALCCNHTVLLTHMNTIAETEVGMTASWHAAKLHLPYVLQRA